MHMAAGMLFKACGNIARHANQFCRALISEIIYRIAGNRVRYAAGNQVRGSAQHMLNHGPVGAARLMHMHDMRPLGGQMPAQRLHNLPQRNADAAGAIA